MELEWPIDTLEPLSFVLARLLDPLSAVARASGSRRGGAAAGSPARRSHRARACIAAPGRHARCARAAHAPDAGSRIASAWGRRRHRHDRDRSSAGAGDSVFAAGAGAALSGNRGNADGPTRRARRRDPMRIGRTARHASAGWLRNARVRPRPGIVPRTPIAVARGAPWAGRASAACLLESVESGRFLRCSGGSGRPLRCA